MSSQPQVVAASATKIAPIQLKPVADVLLVIPARSSSIQYIVGKIVPGSPAVAEVPTTPGRGKILGVGKPGDANYIAPSDAIAPIRGTPAVPAVPDSVISVDQGTVEMSDDEWNAWNGDDDNAYRTAVVAKRLGLTLA